MKIELVVGDWVLYESIRYDDEDDDVIWLGIVYIWNDSPVQQTE